MAREMGFDSGKSNETYINVISSITGSAASQVNIYYGYVIPVVVCKLQEKIKQEIEKSTFYKVSSVNVNVVGIVSGN